MFMVTCKDYSVNLYTHIVQVTHKKKINNNYIYMYWCVCVFIYIIWKVVVQVFDIALLCVQMPYRASHMSFLADFQIFKKKKNYKFYQISETPDIFLVAD